MYTAWFCRIKRNSFAIYPQYIGYHIRNSFYTMLFSRSYVQYVFIVIVLQTPHDDTNYVGSMGIFPQGCTVSPDYYFVPSVLLFIHSTYQCRDYDRFFLLVVGILAEDTIGNKPYYIHT